MTSRSDTGLGAAVGWRSPFAALVVMTVANRMAFAAWWTLARNSAVDGSGFSGREIGIQVRDLAPASGVSFTINHIAAMAIPVIFGLVWLWSPAAVFLAGAGMVVVSLFLRLLVPREPCQGRETGLGRLSGHTEPPSDRPAIGWNRPIAEKLIDSRKLNMMLRERWHPLFGISSGGMSHAERR